MRMLTDVQPSTISSFPCGDMMTMAERELSAFFTATFRLFGTKQAELCAEYWLDELIDANEFPTSPREWRSITVKATARLANRLNISSTSPELQIA